MDEVGGEVADGWAWDNVYVVATWWSFCGFVLLVSTLNISSVYPTSNTMVDNVGLFSKTLFPCLWTGADSHLHSHRTLLSERSMNKVGSLPACGMQYGYNCVCVCMCVCLWVWLGRQSGRCQC